MVFATITLTFSDLALQVIVGAVAAGLTGRAMRGAGFGLLGDLLFGVIGAIVANFAVSYFKLFNSSHYGLPGEMIVAAIGAILLVVVVHLFSGRRTSNASV
ncbi:MAG TPA: GlsB/YeaQ/YmgE family stress response membrane protein [Ktedonobacterales bacterium]|jgi:uncharacterized membrane protein YeaQ/YmgE (transglycosylase-associated protein family)|nr:GlsB/YeaQ/YmgE family stress response membrane protein [Ktedonobacterales bacterium]